MESKSSVKYRLVFPSEMIETLTQGVLQRVKEAMKCEVELVDDGSAEAADQRMVIVKVENATVPDIGLHGVFNLLIESGADDLLAGGAKFVVDEQQTKHLSEDHSKLGSTVEAIRLYTGCDIQVYGHGEQEIPPFLGPKDSLVMVTGGERLKLLCAIQQISLAIFPPPLSSTISALFIHVPKDVIPSILSALPVKPLTKFKKVGKPWYSLINSKVFIEEHLEASTKMGNQMVLVETDPARAYNLRIVKNYDNQKLRSAAYRRSAFLPRKMSAFPFHLYTRGAISCKGLICFFGSGPSLTPHRFSVCNASTGNHSTLHIENLAEFRIHDDSRLGKFTASDALYGFGYRSTTDDFNVITLVHHTEKEASFYIYSVGKGALSQTLPAPQIVFDRRFSARGVFLGGCIHWMEREACGKTKPKIISLNLEALRFEDVIVLPDYDPQSCPEHLEVLDGKLSFVLKRKRDTNTECFIWIMDKYGSPESWRQLEHFTWSYPTSYNERPMCLSGSGGLLAFHSGDNPWGQYKLYSPSGDVQWAIPVMTPVVYIESLYSPTKPKNSVDCTGKEWETEAKKDDSSANVGNPPTD